MQFISIRDKFISFTTATMIAAVLTLMALFAVLWGISMYRVLNQNAVTAEQNLIGKGKLLVVNNSHALKGMAEDNAFLYIKELVTRTVNEDNDVVYGIYMDERRRPWVLVEQIKTQSIIDSANNLHDSMSIWASTVLSVSYKKSKIGHDELYEFAAPVMSENVKIGTIRYGLSMESTIKAAAAARHKLLIQIFLFIVIAAAFGTLILIIGIRRARKNANAILYPLEKLTTAAHSIASGEYGSPITIDSNDEVGLLARNFDSMRSQVKEYTDNLQGMVTARTKELEAAMQNLSELKDKAESATKAKSEFLANMSHEIRTPMNAVIGFGELLKNTALSDVQVDYVDTICNSGSLLISLINDILDISKIESSQMTLEEIDFDLEYLIGSIMKILRQRIEGKPIDLILLYDDAVPLNFKGDPTRLRQILLNLTNNAIKFTDRGEVCIKVALDTYRQAPEGKQQISIAVSDTGIGIPENRIGELFKSFVQVDSSITRKYGGTGLGLAIAKNLVELMGGSIGLTSKYGVGTEFKMTIPFPIGQPATAKEIHLVKLEGLKGKKVLIVDDNEHSRQILMNCCINVNMVIVGVVDLAQKALDLLDKNGVAIDLILSDIMMPEMDGFQLVQRIRNNPRFANVKIIALTSDALPGISDKSAQAGFDAYLTKPFLRKDLYEILQATFGDYRKDDKQIITRHLTQELLTKDIKILVAEDNPLNQKLMKIVLNQMGCVVEIVSNGREAVDKLRTNTYDVVLMDIQMPEVDGVQATKIIREELKVTVPIIALTAHVFKEEEDRCHDAGMNDFLSKPIDAKKVREKLLKWARPQEEQKAIGERP